MADNNGGATIAHVLKEVSTLNRVTGGLDARMGGIEQRFDTQAEETRRWREDQAGVATRIETHLDRELARHDRRRRRIKLFLASIPAIAGVAALGRWLLDVITFKGG